MQQELLRYLSENYEQSPFAVAEIDSLIFGYLKTKKLGSLKSPMSFSFDQEGPHQRIEQWRSLLKTILMASLKSVENTSKDELKNHWYGLFSHHLGSSFQLEQAYIVITAHLLHIPYQINPCVYQLEEGFTPLSTEMDHPFLNVPFSDWHAELGILWGLIGHLKRDETYTQGALKIAQWHEKNLDHEFKPFKSFLSSHSLSHYENILFMQGVLFHLASLLAKEEQMAYMAKQHFGWFFQSDDYELENISTLGLLLLSWTDILFKEQLTPNTPQLSSNIEDNTLPLIGRRSVQSSFIFSLLGMNVGLGSLKYGEIEIPALGPQLQILGEEKLFGFLGCNPLQKDYMDTFKCDLSEQTQSLSGTLALPRSQLEAKPHQLWKFPADWMSCSILAQPHEITISLRPLQLQSNCFFVFYVSAQRCLIEGEEKILPHSLNQFEGIAKSVNLQSVSTRVTLQTQNEGQKVKIIPLEGHRSFWGANYLIAYHLNNKYSTFDWKIALNSL